MVASSGLTPTGDWQRGLNVRLLAAAPEQEASVPGAISTTFTER